MTNKEIYEWLEHQKYPEYRLERGNQPPVFMKKDMPRILEDYYNLRAYKPAKSSLPDVEPDIWEGSMFFRSRE